MQWLVPEYDNEEHLDRQVSSDECSGVAAIYGAMDLENEFDNTVGESMSEYKDGVEMDAISRFGVSEELIGLFADLREVPGISGRKFRHDDVAKLERAIVFRNYGKSCLELSHLLAAVLQIESMPVGSVRIARASAQYSPLLQFFWIEENITPQRVRAAFTRTQSSHHLADSIVSLGAESITLKMDDDTFSISPTRVGYLALLLEFLMYVDPQVISTAEQHLAKPSSKVIQAFSSALQKKIYAFLDEHLISAQLRRRFRYLISWCRENRAGQQNLESFIDDAAVLAFWCEAVRDQDDGLGFRRYRTVGEDFYTLLKALDIGRAMGQIAISASIGVDVEAGEWHPDQLEQTCEEMNVQITDLNFMAKQIKFFSHSDWVELSKTMLDASEYSLRLPLTLVRMDVFGGLQAVLIQAEKDKNQQRIAERIQLGPVTDYSGFKAKLEEYANEIHAAKLLGLGLFLELKVEDSLALIADLLSAQALVDMRQHLAEDKSVAKASLLDGLPALTLQIPELNRLCQQAKEKFKKTKRAGFKQLPETDELTQYSYALGVIDECRRLRNRYSQCLDALISDDSTAYNTDLSLFKETLHMMYGETL
jgi:hypothetical protein